MFHGARGLRGDFEIPKFELVDASKHCSYTCHFNLINGLIYFKVHASILAGIRLIMIQQFTIKSFEDVYSIGWLLTQWIFRGQSDQTWPLTTKAERISASLELLGPVDLEWLAMEKFQREAQQYTHHVPPLESRADWLAYLQHYGGPTRLLDFTKSIYVALFFAIENSLAEAAIWSFNERKVFENLDSKTSDKEREERKDYTRAHELINTRARHSINDPGLLPVMPSWMSDRQSIQQGVFLYPEDLRQLAKGDGNPEGKRHITFQDNLKAEFDVSADDLLKPTVVDTIEELADSEIHLKRSIIKLIIPNDRELRVHLMAELNKMNVNPRTLFPGLEGLARSYNFAFEGYEVSRMWANAFTPEVFRNIKDH